MAITLASSSPFKKKHIRNNIAYYFDDDRLALVERNSGDEDSSSSSAGEWKSVATSVTNDADATKDQRMVVYYHSRYGNVTDITDDIETDIGLKYGLHLAFFDYFRYSLMVDRDDQQWATYYYKRFREKIAKYPYRKAAVRGIQLYNLS